MIIKQTSILLGILLTFTLTACFDNTDGGDDNKTPADNTPIVENPNNSGNTDPDTDTAPEPVVIAPTPIIIPKPTVPAFTVAGATVNFDFTELTEGYSYTIYFSETELIDTTNAAQVNSTIITPTTQSLGQSFNFSSFDLDLTLNKTIYIHTQARDNLGNSSELSESKQLTYLAIPATPTVTSLSNTIKVEWPIITDNADNTDLAYNIYYSQIAITPQNRGTSVAGGPFTTGSETFTAPDCANKYTCSIAMVAVGQNTESAPVYVNQFALTPATPETPSSLSALGSTITVKFEQNTLSLLYSHQIYVATEDFMDKDDAFLLGSIARNRFASIDTWTLPDAMQLDLRQNQTLYVRAIAIDPNASDNTSALSDVQQIKYLAPPSDITNITAINRNLTIEWPVVAGNAYNVYIKTGETFSFVGANSISDEPFIDGLAETTCNSDAACSIGITVIEGDSESDPIVISDFNISSFGLRRPIQGSFSKTGEQYKIIFVEDSTQDGYSVYYSTSGTVTKDNQIYDSEIEGIQSSVTHNIPAYYDTEGGMLSYLYSGQSYIKNAFTNPDGEAKTFYAYSRLKSVGTYTPAIDDFTIPFSNARKNRDQIEIVGGSLYSLGYMNNTSTSTVLLRHVLPLTGEEPVSVSLPDAKMFAIEPTNTDTIYYFTSYYRNIFGASVLSAALHKKIVGGDDTWIELTSSPNDQFIDMVQSATHLYLLTRTKVLKIAKASINGDGAFDEMLILADTVANPYPKDLEISPDDASLFIATENGVLSVSTSDTFPTIANKISEEPVSLLAVNSFDLYFVEQTANGIIKKIPLTGGEISVVKEYVTSTQFLKVANETLYFTAAEYGQSSTYRMSLLDNMIDKVVKFLVFAATIDTSDNGEGIYLTGGVNANLYHFPESFYTAPPLPPTVGEITTTPSDTLIKVGIINAFEASVHEINGVLNGFNLTDLPNGIPVEITVTAYNISGPSEPITVTSIPVLSTPIISEITVGVNSGEISISAQWLNPIERDITLKVYRSTSPLVDIIDSNLVETVSLVAVRAWPYPKNYATFKDTALANEQFYYYRVVISDGLGDSSGSNEVGGITYAPYISLAAGGADAPPDGNLAVDGSNVFYASGNQFVGIRQYSDYPNPISLFYAGQNPSVVAPNTTHLVADFFTLYAIGSDKRILKITQDLANATADRIPWQEEELAVTPNVMNQLLLSSGTLYMSGAGEIISFSTFANSELTSLYTTINSIENLVEEGAYIYWFEAGKDIKRMFKTGGTVETLMTNDAIISFDIDPSSEKIFYSIASGEYFTITQYNVTDDISTVVTEASLHASFALIDGGFLNDVADDLYVAVQKSASTGSSYQAFAKIDAAGTETTIRIGIPKTIYVGAQPPKLLAAGATDLYYTLPQYKTYKVQ